MHEGWYSDSGKDYGESDSESIESQIDSEIEIALYGQIHHISDLQNPNSSVHSHIDSEIFDNTIDSNTCKLESDHVAQSNQVNSNNKTSLNQSKSGSNKSAILNCNSSDFEVEVISEAKGSNEVIIIDDTPGEKKPKKKSAAKKNRHVRRTVLKSLSTDVISVSSNSSNEWLVIDNLSNHSNEDIAINVNDAFSKFLQSDSNDESWVIDGKDKFCGQVVRNRYYNSHDVQCKNCCKRGHTADKCPTPRKTLCYLCGSAGHTYFSCKDKLCFVCGGKYHTWRTCLYYTDECCERCGVTGHLKEICPDLWRQYYLTTELHPVVHGSSEKKKIKYCYNCSKKGHYGHCCPKKRMGKYIPANTPFIIAYDDILFSNKKKGKKRKKDFDSPTENTPKKIKDVKTIPAEVSNKRPQIKNNFKSMNKNKPLLVMSSSVPHNSRIDNERLSAKQKKKLISFEEADFRLHNKRLRESSDKKIHPPIVKSASSAASIQCVIQGVSGQRTSQNKKFIKELEKKYNSEFLPSNDNSRISRTVCFNNFQPISKNKKKKKLTKQLEIYNSSNDILSETVILDNSELDVQILNIAKNTKRKKRKKKPFFRPKNCENSRGFQLSKNLARQFLS